MDLNGDGHKDVISGGYPGELYIFAGNGDGTFAEQEEILDSSGEAINVGSASVPYAVDWDRDGDLDLLVGNIQGEIHFLPNESSNNGLTLDKGMKLEAGGEVIEAGAGDAGPCVADWDGDGNHDLLLGCGDGSVLFYRNSTSSGLPLLADPVELIKKSSIYSGEETGNDTPNYGMRSKLCVADYNGDGLNDLLMGVFASQRGEEPELTPEEKAEKDSLEEAYNKVFEEYRELTTKVLDSVYKEMGLERGERIPEARRDEYMEKYRNGLEKASGYKELMDQLSAATEPMRKYRATASYYGWVWVFLRQPAD